MTNPSRHSQWRRWRPTPLLAGLPGPHAVQITASAVEVGGIHHRTLAVTGYPRQVSPGWLEPLLDHPGPIDVALHLEPVPAAVAGERLRRQLARLQSSQHLDAAHGRLQDPQVQVASHDAEELAGRLARGEGRLFRVGLYVTIRGDSPQQLDAETARVQGLLASLLLDAHPTTFRAWPGWISTLPVGVDALGLQRTMDTRAVAASFPFASADLPLPPAGHGVLVGTNPATGGLIGWDRWAQPNSNQVILARSGAGKSYLLAPEKRVGVRPSGRCGLSQVAVLWWWPGSGGLDGEGVQVVGQDRPASPDPLALVTPEAAAAQPIAPLEVADAALTAGAVAGQAPAGAARARLGTP